MIDQTLYKYGLNLKLNAIQCLKDAHKNIDDVIISSKEFDDLEQAVTSINLVAGKVAERLNELSSSTRFGTFCELNPSFSGQETTSKDWSEQEIAKVWIVDEKLSVGSKKSAVGIAQLIQYRGDGLEN